MNEVILSLKEKLNCETAEVSWKELKAHFERGAVIRVAGPVDLIDVAVKMSEDDTQSIEALLRKQQLIRLGQDDIKDFRDEDCFWAVVVAPWVIVQSVSDRIKTSH